MLKNHYVNRAPYRTASVFECPTTEQVSVELVSEGEVIEVSLIGAGSRAMTLARQKALNWARYGNTDPSHSTPHTTN